MPGGSLVGRIGENPPFFVGSSFSGTANGSGILYLGMNDIPGLFADNSGTLDVAVSLSTDTANPLSLFMDSNKSVTALFTRVFDLTPSVNPSGSGTVAANPVSDHYDEGASVTLTAIAGFPYKFEVWNGIESDRATAIVTMSSDKSPVALFRELRKTTQTPQVKSGTIYNDGNPMPTIRLEEGEWVDGGVSLTGVNPNTRVRLLDASFAVVQDLGVVSNGSFRFQATRSGEYVVKIKANYMYSLGYTVNYTIYSWR